MGSYSLADKMAMQRPAEVREHHPLFAWATEESRRVKETRRIAADIRERLARCEETLAETGEHKEAEEASEELAEAKKAALDADDEVRVAKEKAKAARAALRKVAAYKEKTSLKRRLKAIGEEVAEAEQRIVGAVADGKVPPVLERDPKVTAAVRGLASMVGKDGIESVTLYAGENSVTIDKDDAARIRGEK